MLRAEVARLESKLEEYRAARVRGRSLTQEMQAELAQLRESLGFVAVYGPGLTIVLKAPHNRIVTPQAQDLAGIVNELWAAGAEAVAINGVRLTASDGIAPKGAGVRMNGRVLRDPFSVTAIGDPEALEGALLVRGGPVDGLRGIGLTVTLQRRRNVVLPARAGKRTLRLAQPDEAPVK